MTREEEIIQTAKIQAQESYDRLIKEDVDKHYARMYKNIAFSYLKKGAEWADANPDGKMLLHVLNKSSELAKKQIIEKVCEYIASNMRCDGYTTQTKAKFIQSLREAMEE